MWWGFLDGQHDSKQPLDQSFLRRLDAPQSIAGSWDARQALWMTAYRCSGVLAPCRSRSSNTSGLIKPSCRSCWLVCDKAWFPQSNAIPNDKPSVLTGFIDTVASNRHVHLADITWCRRSASSKCTVTVPSGLYNPGGYFSVTLYGTDNKLLIPNDLKIYDQTTFSSEPNQDGTTTITLSPSGGGKNGIPTGKDFYGVLRAYVPAPGAIMKVKVEKQ